uniref:phosphatase PAP2 family protein n=1 Tax=Micromonospora acroterricola TaxID=2202421 RepID=UPI001374FA2A|nr:phosphatase PAP2 family protein [Micromonospora acroterricola]
MVLLGLLFLACMWRHRTRPWPQRALLVTTPVAVCLAYAVSEMMKALVAAERPCRVVTDVIILAERCPEPGDWSFPSNHATMAAALATAIVLLVPRMTVVAVPLAALAALSRVVVGVHYPQRRPGRDGARRRDHCSRSGRSGLTHVPPGGTCTPTAALTQLSSDPP